MQLVKRREFISLLGGALFVSLHVHAAAQEGYFGVGHDRWHKDFYLKLNRNDGKGTCCNLMDCRPTQSRMVGDHAGDRSGDRDLAANRNGARKTCRQAASESSIER